MASENPSFDHSFAGKLAILTGAGKPTGIGYATAVALAQRGADIVLHHNSNNESAEKCAEAIRALGVQAIAVQADATRVTFGADIVRETLRAYPGRSIDIIVNNAALGSHYPSASAMAVDTFDATFQANVRGPFTLIQAALPHLTAPGARIINIGSLVGQLGTQYGLFYSASKGALNILTRGWAEELGAKGITINTVAPGPVDTGHVPPEEHPMLAKFRAGQHVKRNGSPEEIAAAVLFLADAHASYISGQIIAVDGGINF